MPSSQSEIRANPGQPVPINPGDYRGLLSKGKYFSYYDPVADQYAANILVQTSTGNPDPKKRNPPQYAFYRIYGTEQQIREGIRQIRASKISPGEFPLTYYAKEVDSMIDDLQADINGMQRSLTEFLDANSLKSGNSRITSTGNKTRQQVQQMIQQKEQEKVRLESLKAEIDQLKTSWSASQVPGASSVVSGGGTRRARRAHRGHTRK